MNQEILNYVDDFKSEADSICTYSDAYNSLHRVKNDLKKEHTLSDTQIGELLECVFGNNVDMDDALCEVFPETFDGR